MCKYIEKRIFGWILATVFSFSALGAYANSYEIGIDLPDLGTPAPIDVDLEDVWDAIKDENINLAMNLFGNLHLQELREKLYSKDWWLRVTNEYLTKYVTRELKKIEADESKSDEEKALEIAELIEYSFGDYTSQKSGSHNLTLQHSMDLGVTRLTWDRKEEVDSCDGLMLDCGYSIDKNGWQNCSLIKWTDYVYKIPDYHIYKLINGEKKHIKTYRGIQLISQKSYNFSLDNPWYKNLKEIYDYKTDDYPGVAEDKIIFDDMYSDLYDKGDSVSYRVVSDNTPYQLGKCGSSERYTSDVALDANGDYMADFIPKKEYDALFAKNNAWLIPVITLLL